MVSFLCFISLLEENIAPFFYLDPTLGSQISFVGSMSIPIKSFEGISKGKIQRLPKFKDVCFLVLLLFVCGESAFRQELES